MNDKLRTIALLVAAAALLAAPAQAEVIAGWDFSQYRASNDLTPAGDLPANYSSLDPTHNAGVESAAFGIARIPGAGFTPTAGSRNCERGVGPPDTAPRACAQGLGNSPVRSNRREPWGPGETFFDSHAVLKNEGQPFQNRLAMQATSIVTVDFEAETVGHPFGHTWSASFGGVTADGTGSASTVDVLFSADGGPFNAVTSVVLTDEDTRFDVALPFGAITKGIVRLELDPTGGTPMIDNVAVKVQALPEPSQSVSLAAGGALIALLARRRRA